MTARFALAPAEQAVRVAESRAYRLSLVPATPTPASPITPSQQRARHAVLVAQGLDPWVARHLVLLESEAGALGQLAQPGQQASREVAAVVRRDMPHAGPPDSPPSSRIARWRWSDIDGIPEQQRKEPGKIGNPLSKDGE